MTRRSLTRIVLLLLVLGSPALLQAQDTASITGLVTDQTDAAISGVNVTLQNTQTGFTYKTITSGAGSYTLNQVKPGPDYQIEFTHDGFTSVVVSGLYMNINATRVQNARLSVGAGQQTVQVSAAHEYVTLDTTDATVGNNFQVQFLNDLPVENRDSPAALFTQQPGITLDGAATGARVDQDRVTLDGLDVNDMATGSFGLIVANAPVDSVQEFRGVTAGRLSGGSGAGGGEFQLVTRSGTDQFHGAVVEYHRDTDLEANDWFNNNSGVPRPPLIRNQFGGNLGGPVLKDRLFFFFDYNGRRDTLTNLVERVVPMNSFRQGNLNYINAGGSTSTLSSAQVAALDPQGIGFNPALLSLINSRYPVANDFSGACDSTAELPICPDLINTASFRFNAPFPYKEDDYVQRIDYTINSRMKIFGRGTFTKTHGTQNPIQFPGDPQTYPNLDMSYAWVVGHTWTIGDNKINQAYYGETYENYAFPNTYNPTGITQYGAFGGTGTGSSTISSPYASAINAQSRTYPIPIIRDDFSWDKGSHTIQIGGTFKYISPDDTTILNYNSPTIGLGGYTQSLAVPSGTPSLRPGDIGGGIAPGLYDEAFALALAPFSQVTSTFNYNAAGAALPQGSGQSKDYRYYETEIYLGDTWKVTPSLTLSYGVRWDNFSVPYERNGIESVQNFAFDTYFGDRVAQSAAGASGNLAVPFIAYTLGGKANNAPGYFHPDYGNFAPRFAFAYNPEFDRKTVFNGGAGIIYDQTVINAVQYQQSQYSYLFQAAAANLYGTVGNAYSSLMTDQRLTSLTSPPPPPSPPAIAKPFLPFVSGTGANAVPTGLAIGEGNEIIDPKLTNPYSIQFNFGMQHEFAHGYILKTTYVGRLGRRLLAQADASQLIDFPDKISGQLMSTAFANVTQQLRAGVNPANVTPQPWYENVLYPGSGVALGYANNTAIVAQGLETYAQRGDFADTTWGLSGLGVLPPNVGMPSQFAEDTFYTNKGFSSYNGLLVTLHKNLSYGLQFDLNYTWSHSIDNVSLVANQAAFSGYGFICDVLRPRECRGNSDFDVTNYLNGNFIYDLPVGRGKMIAANAPRLLDEVIGGWIVSGLPSWHTGNAYFVDSNAYVAGFANDAPAILVGQIGDLRTHLNGGKGAPLYAYSNPNAALADYVGPIGFQIGSRNNLRGPGYFDLDLGLGKTFPLVSRVNLKFRVDAFNAFNHPNFSTPSTNITAAGFGVISSTVSSTADPFNGGNAARVLQGALRLEF